ncbi:nitric oxide synthase-interacting protein [Hydra vulgaris]|uniref:Nitric oxide synthase-interacting protein n=1 Tax=Hydra vulgaris TaxID=6087 RepID=A0ABM4CD76_HYDVU
MTRHGRNSTAGAVYTYHEKQRDSKTSGWGSLKTRFSKDAIKEFDCCSLTLQPCKDPVVTTEGHLYEREAILEYILHQKQTFAKKIKAYKKQLKKDKEEAEESNEKSERLKVSQFIGLETSIATKRENPFKSTDDSGSTKKKKDNDSLQSIKNTSETEKMKLPSFWIPTLTPQAKETRLEKPDSTVYCPMSGKVLKMKDLISVKFTLAPHTDSKSLITKHERYICPVTKDVLSNKVPCAVLRPSGHVVTIECIEKFVKKDWVCPITGNKLHPSDIIEIKRGGTGFAGVSGSELEGKLYGASLMCG